MDQYGKKMGLPKGTGLIIVAVVILMVIGYVITHVSSVSVKTESGLTPEVKTPEVQPAENAVVNAATGAVVIDSSPLLSRWGPLFSVDNIPAEIKLPGYENLYVTNFKIGNNKISGDVENRGTKSDYMTAKITFVRKDGYSAGSGVFLHLLSVKGENTNGYSGNTDIMPGKRRSFEVIPEEAKLIISANPKYFQFYHG